ncbi:hypothetical protein AAVH_18207 [Aphelenchoides avenae]|nr:hypothetical protein AAVH_18207 [Aphelenchus avenae]
MPNVSSAFFALVLAFAVTQLVNCDDSKPHRMCGKKLLRHAAAICNAVECDLDEQNAPPKSAEGALKNLAHNCCTIGCSNELIATFCCSDPADASEAKSDDVDVSRLTDVLVF